MDVFRSLKFGAAYSLSLICLGACAADEAKNGPDESAHIPDFQALGDAGTSSAEPDAGTQLSVSIDAAAASPSGGSCQIKTIDVYGAAPDMLIVLDRSLSMSLNRRWEPSKNAVKTITRDFGGLLQFGLSVFPGSGGDCAQGQLDVPLMIRNGDPIAAFVDHTSTSGLTPTGPALTQALRILGDRSPVLDANVRPGYVLLVTDGEPNCQALPLFPDTVQQDAARAAVKALKDKHIPTYVIGYQIDSSYQSMMNELAQLGGTNSYRPAENADQIVSTFRQITKDVVKCSFDLSEVPEDARKVRVQIDQTSIALDGADGWNLQGKTITLQGNACATLKDGKGHDLKAQVECTEVVLE